MSNSAVRFVTFVVSLCTLTSVVTSSAMQAQTPSSSAKPHTFTVRGRQFLMDGQPYQVIAGEMHYPRVPREYWRDRLHKAKLMGLNTITTYAFWNIHEPRPGVYDFSGQNDIAEYIREAQQEGLNVILRPGPYVCAEWELGGYPSWLLKDRALVLRSSEPRYTAAVRIWFARLAKEITPLLLKNGGPIIAVQVENEYGAYGDDKGYLEGVKQAVIDSGMGGVMLYTSNQPGDTSKGSLPELPTVVNFGAGGAEKAFSTLQGLRPDGPRMTGEYWAGWFDKWGEGHHETDGQKEAAEFRWMLERRYSVSVYMFHGGTTFGWMNGADSQAGTSYHPDTSSYDYDAPLDESGRPRYKFALFQKVIADVTHRNLPTLPKQSPLATFPIKRKMLTASLWRNLPTPVNSKTPLTFEDLGQNYGYVLYRTSLAKGDGGKLVLHGLHDYAQIYVDQKLVGILDRRLGVETLDLPRQTHASTLDILVENTGRVNYSRAILTERAGLTGEVTVDGKTPRAWKIFSLPMSDLSQLRFLPAPCQGPCFFQTEMEVAQPADTFLDTRGVHKGQIWVENHNMGRFWSIGPQFTTYTPAPWLKKGITTVRFFDLQADATDHLSTVVAPVFGEVKHSREDQ